MKKSLLFLIIFITFNLCCQAQDLLKSKDVHQIMKQILNQHLGNNQMSSKILQSSLSIYIEQFDPNHIYLLESEVAPFMQLSQSELDEFLTEYQQDNFTLFEKLNHVFQSSIERSRQLRQGLEADVQNTLSQSETHKYQANTFPANIEELKNRLLEMQNSFLLKQKTRYGESMIKQNHDALLKNYEEQLREFENQYLYQNEKGTLLPKNEQENLFIIHILKALASSLDSHTSFYQTNEAFDIRLRLLKEFQGIGLGFAETINGPTVTGILPNSSAAKSQLIEVGDILISINGEIVSAFPFEKVMDLLHDETKAEIDLTFKRMASAGQSEKTYNILLKRELIIINKDRVDVKTVKYGNGIIGIITLHAFYEGKDVSSEKDVRAAIEKLEQEGSLKGLILDLRDNRGGFLTQAVKVAGLFISDGIVVISKYDNGEERIYRDIDGKKAYDGPLIILTSKITASAAEIVAQALQDYGVALVVGDVHTYGKGTIQTQTVTDNQSASYFKVTVGRYYTVSGKTPQKEGVKADIVVPGHWNNQEVGEEYADSVPADKISPSYDDPLLGVPKNEKPWYLQYYTPKLQQRLTTWRNSLPALKKNSEYRIAKNKNYQYFINGEAASNEDNEGDNWMNDDKKAKNYGEDDLQLEEAVNIAKDMYQMHASGKK